MYCTIVLLLSKIMLFFLFLVVVEVDSAAVAQHSCTDHLLAHNQYICGNKL